MKKNILFVDDEQLVLQGIKRSLRKMRGEWEMDFVNSGQEAIIRISEKKYDIIVSDMRMPLINGAELLKQVREISPKTMRFILSGHADYDLILQSTSATHQFLNKPCDPIKLKEAVDRANDIESFLGNHELKSLLNQLSHVPSIPKIIEEINCKLDDPSTEQQEIGDLIAQDIGMTSKILSLANSAFFGNPQTISHPHEAIQYLGFDVIKSLVLTIQLFSQFEKSITSRLPIEELWLQSLNIANAAKRIASHQESDKKTIDEAFTAGLLHNIGQLILCSNFPDLYDEILMKAKEEQKSLIELENEMIGSSHAEIGAYLLGLWALPLPIIDAIRLHHSPSSSSDQKFTSLTAVHVASAILTNEELRTSDDVIDETYLERLSLNDCVEDWTELIKNDNQG